MTFDITQISIIAAGCALVVGIPLAVITWFRTRKADLQEAKEAAKGQDAAAGGPEQATPKAQAGDQLRDAERFLKESARLKGATLSSMPVFLILGPSGAGGTSFVEKSGVEKRLLAGQANLGAETVPTKTLNIWLVSGKSVLIEISEQAISDGGTLGTVLKYLKPGRMTLLRGAAHPPRGILFCIDHASVEGTRTPDELAALAHPWNAHLETISQALETPLPVYVLFTKMDKLSGAAEFIANFAAGDLRQTLGSTFTPFRADSGPYGEEMPKLLNREFSRLGWTLCDNRVQVLNRQDDRLRPATEYQFPRYFLRLQTNVVHFLTGLVQPSPLHVSPFLRGFYFSGIRKATVEASGIDKVPDAPRNQVALTATSFFSQDQLRAQAAMETPQSAGPVEVTEWIFTRPLLEQVILNDDHAHAATSRSAGTDRFRALGLAFASFLIFLFFIGMTVSFFRNRSMEKELLAGATRAVDPAGAGTSLLRFDALRRPMETLVQDRTKHPFWMSFGLYSGDRVFPPAKSAYCRGIRSEILAPLVRQMGSDLGSLSTKGGHADDVNVLKAYMMMTTHPQKADGSFLDQELSEIWKRIPRSREQEGVQSLPPQLRLYGALLAIPGEEAACISTATPGLIAEAQALLRSLNANDHYNSLRQLAGSGLSPVSYDQQFANDAVSDPRSVPGWFTQKGWTKMQALLDHPEESLKADAWVLGESKDVSPRELAAMASEYRARYMKEYTAAWQEYLAAARVAQYLNLEDAAAKLEKISAERSFLITLIGLASENTAGISQLKSVFQPTKAVAPNSADFPAANEYLKQLSQLKNRIAKAAQSTGPAHDADAQEVRSTATTALDAVDQLARSPEFRGDAAQAVKNILLMPITQIGPLLNKQNAEAANGGAAELCRSVATISKTLPFFPRGERSASLDEIQRVFQTDRGQMWSYYEATLRDSLDCTQSDCNMRVNPKFNVTPSYLEFFRAMNRWSRLLYGGTPDPVIRLQIRAGAANHLKQLELLFDDQKVILQAGANEFQNITWDVRRTLKLVANGNFDGEPQAQELFRTEGHWALFEWLYNSEPGSGGANGFTWLPRNGTIKASLLGNGNTKLHRLEIRLADGTNRPLDMRAMTNLSCPAAAVR